MKHRTACSVADRLEAEGVKCAVVPQDHFENQFNVVIRGEDIDINLSSFTTEKDMRRIIELMQGQQP